MKKRDRNNLMFLLSADDKTFDEWFNNCTQDDIDYANELLAMHRRERDRLLLENLDGVRDFPAARSVLEKFTLKGIKNGKQDSN
jgi:hypothetical protein